MVLRRNTVIRLVSSSDGHLFIWKCLCLYLFTTIFHTVYCNGNNGTESRTGVVANISESLVYYSKVQVIADDDGDTFGRLNTPSVSFFQSHSLIMPFSFSCKIIQFCQENDDHWKSTHIGGSTVKYDIAENKAFSIAFLGNTSCSNSDDAAESRLNVITSNFMEIEKRCYLNVQEVYYAPKDYCIKEFIYEITTSGDANRAIWTWTANVQICSRSFIVNKCCGLREGFDEDSRCRLLTSTLKSNSSYSYLPHSETGLIPLSFRDSSLQTQTWKSVFSTTKVTNGNGRFRVRASGVFSERRVGVFLRGRLSELKEGYCLDSTQFPIMKKDFSGKAASKITLFYDNSTEVVGHTMASAIGIMAISAAPFAFLSAAANLFTRRNIIGLTLSTYFVSAGFADVMAGSVILSVGVEAPDDEQSDVCANLDIIQKFTYSSATFWLAIVNFDLWWNFRKLRNTNSHTNKEELTRFFYYLLFGICGAGLHVSVSYLVGHLYKSDVAKDGVIRPCVLYTVPSLAAFSMITVLLILLNTIFFILTWLNIRKHRKSTKAIHQNGKKNTTTNKSKGNSKKLVHSSFKLYTKLFLMAGPNRIVRILILLSHFNYSYLSPVGVGLEFIFTLPDLVLFILVFWDLEFRKKLAEDFPALKDICCCKLYLTSAVSSRASDETTSQQPAPQNGNHLSNENV